MTTTTTSAPTLPPVQKADPLRAERQAVELYGDRITPETVRALMDAIEQVYMSSKPDYMCWAEKRGPQVAKHYRAGNRAGLHHANMQLAASLVADGAPFEGLRKGTTTAGAADQVWTTLETLARAAAAGIWGE